MSDIGELAARAFWRQVAKQPGFNGCWLWTGPHNGRYGRVGRRTYAHRVSYEMKYGPIPAGLQIMHTCDTPLCVRPDHLRVGTGADNMRDAQRKGRLATGERHGLALHPESIARGARHGTKTMPWTVKRGEERPASKLTEEQVRQIRALSDMGESRAVLARRFGVTTTVIRRIARREAWKHVL